MTGKFGNPQNGGSDVAVFYGSVHGGVDVARQARNQRAGSSGAGRKAQHGDAALAANIKAALGRTRGLVARDIKTRVEDGVVTLAGVVDNAEQVDRAEAVVKKLRGVREVRNKLIQSSMFVWD